MKSGDPALKSNCLFQNNNEPRLLLGYQLGSSPCLLDTPFALEYLEIAVDNVEGDLPAALPGLQEHLKLPLVALYGALGVELEPQRHILLPDLHRTRPRHLVVGSH